MHFRLKFQDKPLTQLNDNELINYIFIIMFSSYLLWFFYVVVVDFFGNKRMNYAYLYFFNSIHMLNPQKIKLYVKNKSGIVNCIKDSAL